MAASDARILIASAAHGATSLGIVTAFGFQVDTVQIPIRGEGVVGPTAMGEVARAVVAFVEFLVNPGIAINTEASLVLTCKDTAGNNKVITLTNMRALGEAFAMDRDSPPGRFRQEFAHVGSLASANHSYS